MTTNKKKAFSTNEIRKRFLDYFVKQGHTQVASSSLIPGNDPTLLFNNAGMVQFKDVFLGIEQRTYTRATSAQRCVRAGGKHNDLENVGYTRRHHTFFEMLGNFSFGDYFKREAIQFAWQFLTKELQLPAEKLWITVFKDDKESESIWLKEIGVNPQRFSRCGEKDNFWQMGDVGPCGPCTEIFYDHGEAIAGGPPGTPEEDGDRYVEIWNLVFMQYERNTKAELHPLPKPCVDTGMGLERIAAVLQGVHDNYDIDLFHSLLKALGKIIACEDLQQKSMRVIVDHIRAAAFLIVDGVVPSNEGRGYVLRRIIRRAIRHGVKLGETHPFFYKMAEPLSEIMGEAYPELKKSLWLVQKIIREEEEQFSNTLSRGLKKLEQDIENLSGSVLSGDLVFQLYDTYGFPHDLTADILRERGMTIDMAGFEHAMARQRAQSQQSQQFSVDQTKKLHVESKTEFLGYEQEIVQAQVTELFEEDFKPIKQLESKQRGVVVLDKTAFYAESGGQVGDRGDIEFANGVFRVEDTRKQGEAYLHIGVVLRGQIEKGQTVTAKIDALSRQAIRLNHTATHLLHAALRQVLGHHVSQKGSLVNADYLRFDFSHTGAVTPQALHQVEQLVNEQIRANLLGETQETTPEAAKEAGAMALFGERYGDRVRVLKLGDFSTEICGGTHAIRSGDIGLFKITTETACASGIRRIEAVTGVAAIEFIQKEEKKLAELASLLKCSNNDLTKRAQQLLEHNRELERQISKIKQQQASNQFADLGNKAVAVNQINVLATQLDDVDSQLLRNTLDQLKQSLGESAIVLASVTGDKIQLVASVSKSLLKQFNATELLNHVAKQVGGKGGGRPDLAQGGGTNIAALPAALDSVAAWVEKHI